MHDEFDTTLAAKSDQINAADLAGIEMTVTIKSVKVNSSADQKVDIQLHETGKVFRPCLGMRRLMKLIWKCHSSEFSGRKLTLYCDPDVKYGGEAVGGIRIKAASHLSAPEKVMVKISRTKLKQYTVQPIPIAEPKPADPAHLEAARAAAAEGTDAFRAWWSANPEMRDSAKSIMPELQEKCAQVDAAKAPPDDDEELPM